jgi:hypothetical protein
MRGKWSRVPRGFVAAAVVVLVAAVAGAVTVAGRPGGRTHQGAALTKPTREDVAGNRGEPSGEAKAEEGDEGEDGEDPAGAAEQAYAARAYPADEIPFALTANAQRAWAQLKGKSARGKNAPGQWTLAGPSTANYPGVLTFSGADYTTSGRITALAIDPACSQSRCRVWAGAAGGGVWRTDNALAGNGTSWTFVSGAFGTNAIGALTYANGVLYAGTGEPNASGDSEAGLGIWRSTDGGTSWSHLPSTAFDGRSISAIAVDPTNPDVLYVGSARGVRGVSSVTGGATSNPPVAAPFGLYKSTDGGATFALVWNGNLSVRGVNAVALDPSNPAIVYAAAFQQGVWRSTDGGATFSRIFTPIAPGLNTDRAEFAVAKLPGGKTRMYVGDGAQGAPAARLYRTDDATAATPVFTNLTTAQSSDYCTGQCWYDNVVYSPPGKPDVVYLGGSYSYGTYGSTTNGRAFIRSSDAGASFTDMTWDATSSTAPNGQHPDSHAIVEIPGTDAAIFGTDGGLMRSSGAFADVSAQCDGRGLAGSGLALCRQLLSAVPTTLYSLNKTLSTLQFQSLSVAPDNAKHLQGGTQDNGTFETYGSAVTWPQIIYGDGGQSGFNAADPTLRFNSFFGQFHDANFRNGDPTKWVIISGDIAASPEGSAFYAPIVADPSPANAGSIFEGSQSVWRTQDWGGDAAYLEANCPEFTTPGDNDACGDFERIGPAGATDLTAASAGYRGTSRPGGTVAAIERTAADTGTMWVATSVGRVFVSKNANDPAGAVTYRRLDTLAAAAPGRFVSGIAIDPADPNHAWISYSGYNVNTPSQPGHVFSVTYDPAVPSATWTRLDGTTFPDLPSTDVTADSNGDLYASTDFGVMRLPSGSGEWEVAGTGLPQVEVAGLTIVPAARKLYAATHGRSAWQLTLP